MTRRRLVPLVLLVVALLAIVALAAGGRPLAKSATGGSGLPAVFWNFAFTTTVIVVLIAIVVALVLYSTLGPEAVKAPSPFKVRVASSLAVLLVVVVLIVVIARFVNLHHLFRPEPPTTTSSTTTTTPQSGGRGRRRPVPNPFAHPGGVRFEWTELVAILGVLVVIGAIGARSRMRPALAWRPSAPERLAAALDESLDDLRAEPDLRRAIIAAYARMETALASVGLPRRPAEAPLEYMERALLSLDAGAPAVRKLTDLFEWASFSDHEPEPAMRDDAIDALVAVRDELRSAERVVA